MKPLNLKINETNERAYINALREYYQNNFKNGQSFESFLAWIETRYMSEDYEDESTHREAI